MKTEKEARTINLILGFVFIIAIVLQFIGHAKAAYQGLGIQAISLALLISVLAVYNHQHR